MPTRFLLAALAALVAATSARAQKVDYARDVLPILSDNCFACHGPDEKSRKAKLRLDVKTDTDSIVPGKSADSEVIRRVLSTDVAEVMPPPKSNKKLTAAQVATLKKWIDDGPAWGTHWAFVKPVRPAVPNTKHETRNPIDAFVRTRLEREKLSPSPEASREVLIRRVTLDLTGLPPTAAEVDDFLKDPSPTAYEKVVDRLLASPRYGERMAWDWLDAARYADSNGYQGDGERTMWPWRDWVVRAFNQNMPYDQFTVWQLAGDLLTAEAETPKGAEAGAALKRQPTPEQVLATGFNRNHMINGEGGRIAEENRVEYVFDQTETTGTVWLGLTLTCCRCHDHKFDPISKKDYFRLFAFFNQTPVNGGGGSGQTAPVIDFGTPELEAKRKAAASAYDELFKVVTAKEKLLREAGMAKNKDGKYETTLPQLIESALRKGPNDRADQNFDELAKFYKDKEPEYAKQLPELRKRKQARDAAANAIPKVMVMADMTKPRDTFQLTRGAYDKREDKVSAGVPEWLNVPVGKEGNRLALARWIVSPDNPLTARVTVNRVWQQFFGNGLVKTTEDFGVQGERPSHPELLDWLAVEFGSRRGMQGEPAGGSPSQGGWDVKALIRLIVTSATYRQSSRVTPELRERDPDNRLLARASRYRLPSWMIRDQALAASGLMTPTIGGPPVKPYQPAGIWEEATFGNKRYTPDKGEALYRRSLYVFWRRIVGPTMFFDTANRQTCSVKTVVTNTPLHALATLNDPTFVEAARVLAQKAMGQGDTLAFAFRSLLARSPTEAEAKVLAASLQKQRKVFAADRAGAEKLLKVGESPRDGKLDAVEHAALAAVCLMMMNMDEVLTRQ